MSLILTLQIVSKLLPLTFEASRNFRRAYVDEQHRAFAVLRGRANRDKEALAAIVSKAAEHTLEESLVSAAVDIADLAINKGDKTTSAGLVTNESTPPVDRRNKSPTDSPLVSVFTR